MTYDQILRLYPYLAHLIKMYQGGLVKRYANGGFVGGLNLINPQSMQKGPLNIDMNINNMLAQSRAGTPAGQLHRGI